jgi:hypothetical protein
MRTVTATLDEEDFLRLKALAATRRVSLEEAVGHLLHGALERDAAVAAGLQALDELARRPDRLPHEEAMTLAVEEQEAMRAEWRASGRP